MQCRNIPIAHSLVFNLRCMALCTCTECQPDSQGPVDIDLQADDKLETALSKIQAPASVDLVTKLQGTIYT